jgi:hypothetical protein
MSTPLTKAYRGFNARLRSAWEHGDYNAISEALAGDVSRLIDLLHARRPLTDEDSERLTDYISRTAPRRRGAPRKEFAREAARLAETLLDQPDTLLEIAGRRGRVARDAIVKYACTEIEKKTGTHVNPEVVHDLLRRPRHRRAISEAPPGEVSRLIDLLHARRPRCHYAISRGQSTAKASTCDG